MKSFTTKVDFTDTVLAEHVNSLQNEVTALQENLGTFIKTGSGWVGSFDLVTTNWNTLKDRLANMEYGLKDIYDDYVSDVGGSVIIPSAIGVKGLVIKATSGQTANLLELQNSSSTVVSKVDASGNVFTSNQQLVPIVYSSSQPSSVPAGTVWVDSTSTPTVLTTQSGLPSGGTSGQSLVKNSSTDYDVTWGFPTAENLGGTTLKSTVTGSSLTSVGTLNSLSVTNTVTAGSFSGDGAGITNTESSDFGMLTLMGAWV